ncbi:MAG: 3-oxoacyl-ACP reductase FabG [Deltaproteobacteria bacterium]|nr:3-oxoacyl-ACP reductase FabG [Deltaproteobacteria bacterium]MBW1737585.1 3-oxoacyl-ACP reductase FabG [Deltaproteobacteria bacterium]MBW1910767.1 3-oxoacyl-ACP reductase FabG [Deltaproteobacteria bacterium]MBW2034503.1 3-oxoacyl-ACP reductase FabG [Deltaproteobacteria bacterium]MBW2114081.1 3-oxoacyl-ACP reductase FabG [Deltaproteobacteria bacterium]
MRLKDKIALVTGSSRGVGRAVALGFAKEGAKLVVNYTSNEKAANEVVEAVGSMGSKAVAVKADVAQKSDAENLVTTAIDTFGRLDILVNNAGFTRPALMIKMTEDQWDQVVDIHLKGAFLCSQAAANKMKEQNSGKIINVMSVAGLVGTVGQINYSAAKGGILSMTKSIARELARYNICANVISLGIVATDMTEKIRSDEKLKEIYMNRILLKRFAEPDDISPAFVFLASDESNYITGQLLCVDGGYGMI